jgi:hypothetical protein
MSRIRNNGKNHISKTSSVGEVNNRGQRNIMSKCRERAKTEKFCTVRKSRDIGIL